MVALGKRRNLEPFHSCDLPCCMQSEVQQQYEQEFEAFQSGKYKESAENWLQSSWQGDALQVRVPFLHLMFCESVHPTNSQQP